MSGAIDGAGSAAARQPIETDAVDAGLAPGPDLDNGDTSLELSEPILRTRPLSGGLALGVLESRLHAKLAGASDTAQSAAAPSDTALPAGLDPAVAKTLRGLATDRGDLSDFNPKDVAAQLSSASPNARAAVSAKLAGIAVEGGDTARGQAAAALLVEVAKSHPEEGAGHQALGRLLRDGPQGVQTAAASAYAESRELIGAANASPAGQKALLAALQTAEKNLAMRRAYERAPVYQAMARIESKEARAYLAKRLDSLPDGAQAAVMSSLAGSGTPEAAALILKKALHAKSQKVKAAAAEALRLLAHAGTGDDRLRTYAKLERALGDEAAMRAHPDVARALRHAVGTIENEVIDASQSDRMHAFFRSGGQNPVEDYRYLLQAHAKGDLKGVAAGLADAPPGAIRLFKAALKERGTDLSAVLKKVRAGAPEAYQTMLQGFTKLASLGYAQGKVYRDLVVAELKTADDQTLKTYAQKNLTAPKLRFQEYAHRGSKVETGKQEADPQQTAASVLKTIGDDRSVRALITHVGAGRYTLGTDMLKDPQQALRVAGGMLTDSSLSEPARTWAAHAFSLVADKLPKDKVVGLIDGALKNAGIPEATRKVIAAAYGGASSRLTPAELERTATGLLSDARVPTSVKVLIATAVLHNVGRLSPDQVDRIAGPIFADKSAPPALREIAARALVRGGGPARKKEAAAFFLQRLEVQEKNLASITSDGIRKTIKTYAKDLRGLLTIKLAYEKGIVSFASAEEKQRLFSEIDRLQGYIDDTADRHERYARGATALLADPDVARSLATLPTEVRHQRLVNMAKRMAGTHASRDYMLDHVLSSAKMPDGDPLWKDLYGGTDKARATGMELLKLLGPAVADKSDALRAAYARTLGMAPKTMSKVEGALVSLRKAQKDFNQAGAAAAKATKGTAAANAAASARKAAAKRMGEARKILDENGVKGARVQRLNQVFGALNLVIGLHDLMKDPTKKKALATAKDVAGTLDEVGKLASVAKRFPALSKAFALVGKVAHPITAVLGYMDLQDSIDRQDPVGAVADVATTAGGTIATAGLLLSATGIGAPVGVPLAAIGGFIATAGTLVKWAFGDSVQVQKLKKIAGRYRIEIRSRRFYEAAPAG